MRSPHRRSGLTHLDQIVLHLLHNLVQQLLGVLSI